MADDNISDFIGEGDDAEFLLEDESIINPDETSQFALKKLYQHHPECVLDYIEDVIPKVSLSVVPAGSSSSKDELDTNAKVDKNHITYPFLTVYEKTKIIGMRANQLSQGASPFIKVPDYITKVVDIARLELEQKRLPYIVKRPLPNGEYEYWRLSDLLII
jgi:DNA-directed RNA polymerases I, II, and III subunit RPABC2